MIRSHRHSLLTAMSEVTTMVLKVDLGCHRCYRKIRKLLCKYPEIRDRSFNEKEDTVIIKVVCCFPERIREKLICKGGKTIKSIEIKVPEKPKPPPEKRMPVDKRPPLPKPAPPPPPAPPEYPPEDMPLPLDPKPVPRPPTAPDPTTTTVVGYPPFYPVTLSCKRSYDLGYGITYQPPSSNDGYVRQLPSDNEPYGGWPSGCRCDRCYGCRCDYFTEENPNPACSIM